MQPFAQRLSAEGCGFRKRPIEVLQINMGKYCNQACVHCHVEAGPTRREMMRRETVQEVLRFVERSTIATVDITGGAPELNSHFRELVDGCRRRQCHVIDRCNLTVLFEPGQEDLAEFLWRQGVELICSLPCYTAENVDRQRGRGTFEQSIRALQRLNVLGYGVAGTGLPLHLVYNPLGAFLPPPQDELEQTYKRLLQEHYGIVFNHLYCLTNMPIARFENFLRVRHEYELYMQLLGEAFNALTLDRTMCRNLLSVDWEGSVYDCDFNQMLDLPLQDDRGRLLKIWDLVPQHLEDQAILVGNHCYGCTAGAGSSCGGALLP